MPSHAPRYLTETFVHLFDEMAERPERQWLLRDIGYQQYLREFNTMMLHLPRQCGKTTALVQIFRERGEAAMLITPNPKISYHIATNFGIDRRSILAADQLASSRGTTIHARYFLFDEWQYIQKSKMDDIYLTLASCRATTSQLPIFFGLGTR